MVTAYVYKIGDYEDSCNLCFHRFLWVVLISSTAAVIAVSVMYNYDQTPESNHCIPSIAPFYSQFTCAGKFQDKSQDFYCGDAELFHEFPAKNANNEDCGSVIPACVACLVEGVPLSQAFLCHAAVPGCAPVLGSFVTRQALNYKVENNSVCFVDSGRYQRCTVGLSDSRHRYFPVVLAIGFLCIAISSLVLLLSCSGCLSACCLQTWCCYEDQRAITNCGNCFWSDNDRAFQNKCVLRCPWLFHCCLSAWSLKKLCKSLGGCFWPCISCCGAYYRLCCCSKPTVSTPGGPS